MLSRSALGYRTRAQAPGRSGRKAKRGTRIEWPRHLPKRITLREGVLALLLLTYIWRFHDLAPFVAPLRLAAIATVSSWIFLVLQPNLGRLGQAMVLPQIVLFMAWSAWLLLSVQTALDPTIAWDYVNGVHKGYVTMLLFMVATIASLRQVHLALIVHVFGALVIAFYYAKGGFALWGSPVSMYDVNDLALILNMTIPIAIYYALVEKHPGVQRAFWATAILFAVCALMTRSRGGFLTLGIVTFALMLRVRGLSWKVRIIPPVVLVVGFFFLPEDVSERLSTLFTASEDYNVTDEEGRIQIWTRAWGYMWDHPLLGVGANNFPIAERTLSEAARVGLSVRGFVTHNSFLQVGTESGVVGGLLFILMIFFAWQRLASLAKRFRRASAEEAREFVLLCQLLKISLLAYCVGGFFLSMGYSPYLMSLVAVIAGLELAAPRHALGPVGRRARLSAAPARPQTGVPSPRSSTGHS